MNYSENKKRIQSNSPMNDPIYKWFISVDRKSYGNSNSVWFMDIGQSFIDQQLKIYQKNEHNFVMDHLQDQKLPPTDREFHVDHCGKFKTSVSETCHDEKHKILREMRKRISLIQWLEKCNWFSIWIRQWIQNWSWISLVKSVEDHQWEAVVKVDQEELGVHTVIP